MPTSYLRLIPNHSQYLKPQQELCRGLFSKAFPVLSCHLPPASIRQVWGYGKNAVVVNARQGYRQPSLLRMSHAAQQLHRNYYKRKRFLHTEVIEEEIGEVEAMIDVLQLFIE